MQQIAIDSPTGEDCDPDNSPTGTLPALTQQQETSMEMAGLTPVDASSLHSSRVDSAVTDLPATDDLPTPTQQTPTKSFPFPAASINTDLTPSEQLNCSPNPDTPTGPSTPITPTHDSARDSMTSIALSDTSLDYDHLSPEKVEDVLATPRVNGARRHLRKVSSLDILQNKWAPPERQSTFFDTANASLQTHMSAVSLPVDQDVWATESGETATAFSVDEAHPHASIDRVELLDRGVSQADSTSDTSWRRSAGSSSEEETQVDWQALDKTEEQEKEDKDLPEGAEDESTAFLLARLEQENAKFAADPKANASKGNGRARAVSRPPSMAQLKKLVTGQDHQGPPSIRFSMASDSSLPNEVPPMTELEFWAALVQDYATTASRLPTLTATKIRAGVPPPLRGVVWASMSGARDRELEEAYETLRDEKSPYEGIINKDVGRSFPGVELFREAEGEGQKMLGRVLKCFSLHDKDIGYCQGLGFLVGPLLMNMGESEAFCVLVRLMDHYSLRPSFLPSLSGLHMRIYQFSALLKQHHPKLHQHLADLGVEPAYLSQWFLSCFAVTCPLPMLFRIYDVIFAEGANETVMRVALALMRRHERTMLATTEFEEIMQTLLGHEMWDCYGGDADELVDDFTSIGDIVTHARLTELETEFERQSSEAVGQSAGFLPDVQAAASRFLGRLWAPGQAYTPSKPVAPNGAHTPSPSTSTLSPPSADKDTTASAYSFFTRPTTFLRRSPSKQSIGVVNDSHGSEDSTSTYGSVAASLASTALTEPDTTTANVSMRESMADSMSMKSKPDSMFPTHGRETQELHTQIEDLLTAIGEMQREHAQLAAMLQREREERSEDHKVLRQLLGKLRTDDKEERRRTLPARPRIQTALEVPSKSRPLTVGCRTEVEVQQPQELAQNDMELLVEKAQERLQASVRSSASLETKAQLRTMLARTREELAAAEAQSKDRTARLEAAEDSVVTIQSESEDLRSEVKELRGRVADEFKARQKIEHQLTELKAQARSVERKERLQRAESLAEVTLVGRSDSTVEPGLRKGSTSSLPTGTVANSGGLRELKLGRRESSPSVQSLRPSQRNSILSLTETLPTIVASSSSPLSCTPSSPSQPAESPATPESLSAGMVLAPLAPSLPVPKTGFARRTTSLAAKEILATPQHEPVPEEALLLELVNAKTSEAQAKQEVDELKRALFVGKRKQDEALAQLRTELEEAKAEAAKANQTAQAAKAETEALRLSELSAASTPIFSLPPTPFLEQSHRDTSPAESPAEEKISDIFVPKKAATTPSGGGGWFWQRRAPSKGGITTDDNGGQ